MIPFLRVRRILAIVIVGSVAAPVAAQLHEESFKNLEVLPKDIARPELFTIMGGFTRALGVRCVFCHVGEEGKPPRPQDFQLDDKPTKKKARVMMRMVRDINDKYLATVEKRADPPVTVQCMTCHRGTTQPRMLQDVLKIAYTGGGIDSTLTRYQALRDRYYGGFAYDFGEVPLADVGWQLRQSGHGEDAMRLMALNVEMNPSSTFAKRQQANTAIGQSFLAGGIAAGTDTVHRYQARYGATVVTEELVNDVGYRLLAGNQLESAIALFRLNVTDHPESGNAYDSLGEAYAKHGDRALAIASYTKAVALDSTNTNAKEKLAELRAKRTKRAK